VFGAGNSDGVNDVSSEVFAVIIVKAVILYIVMCM
jgi:hypothetical protein